MGSPRRSRHLSGQSGYTYADILWYENGVRLYRGDDTFARHVALGEQSPRFKRMRSIYLGFMASLLVVTLLATDQGYDSHIIYAPAVLGCVAAFWYWRTVDPKGPKMRYLSNELVNAGRIVILPGWISGIARKQAEDRELFGTTKQFENLLGDLLSEVRTIILQHQERRGDATARLAGGKLSDENEAKLRQIVETEFIRLFNSVLEQRLKRQAEIDEENGLIGAGFDQVLETLES